ncbi:putative secreted protein [Sphingomonas sp. F9_3S_D5_B_2]
MKFTSIIAIYFLFISATAFALLPFGVKTDEEVGAPKVPGQADSAPHRFDLKRHLLKSAAVAAVLFAIYYLNWANGWITPDDLDIYHRL